RARGGCASSQGRGAVAFVDRLWNAAEVTAAGSSTGPSAGPPAPRPSASPSASPLEGPLAGAGARAARAQDPGAVVGSGTGGRSDRAARWILLAALAIGLLRFFRLGEWSLWFDEVITWSDGLTGL